MAHRSPPRLRSRALPIMPGRKSKVALTAGGGANREAEAISGVQPAVRRLCNQSAAGPFNMGLLSLWQAKPGSHTMQQTHAGSPCNPPLARMSVSGMVPVP